MELTRVDCFGKTWAKREDLACAAGWNLPSGSKMRQFLAMAKTSPPGTPMIVGCSAFSAMQIYVAAAAELSGARAVVYVPARKAPSAATLWAQRHGAEVNFIRPGYPSVYRKAARDRAKAEGGCIKWNAAAAVADTAAQVGNLPTGVKRVIVPTGSGLTAAGVLLGLAHCKIKAEVVAVAVSPLSSAKSILGLAAKFGGSFFLGKLLFVNPADLYETPVHAALPDGTPLDPYYAAKAQHLVLPGDCLWVSGRRPVRLRLK